MYEHVCLVNIKKLYKYSKKIDGQQQYKAILEASMVSIPEVFTDNSPMSPTQSVPVKILAQENHSVSFQKHWASNLIMMSAGYVLVNQTKSQPDL